MIKKFRTTVLYLLCLIFIFTLTLNIISLFYSPFNYYNSLNIKHEQLNNEINVDVVPGYHTRLREIDEIKKLINNQQKKFDIKKTTSLVFESLKHESRDILIFENWFLWFLSNLYDPLKKTQNIERIVDGGVGICNEVSAVLNEVALLNKIPARFISLEGHIISELKINNEWILADADYGIVFPFGYEKIFANDLQYTKETVRRLLTERGFDFKTIQKYEEVLLSTENNTVHKIGEAISPRLMLIETFGDIFKWFFSFLFGVALVIFSRKKF